MAKQINVTEYQTRVYTLLQQIPEGRVSTYAAISQALSSSPRAVGGALRRNPFAPEIPCHRVISADGVRILRPIPPAMNNSLIDNEQYIGGFQGDWRKAPSGINCEKKLELLKEEGVAFDQRGMLMNRSQLWAEFKV